MKRCAGIGTLWLDRATVLERWVLIPGGDPDRDVDRRRGIRLDDRTVYQSYAATGRGVEFLMDYYGILDRAPNGRNEGDAWQVWIRRRAEY